jgi:hypothetical protein
MEFCCETGIVERGGSGIEYERWTDCVGLVDISYIRDGSVREGRRCQGAGVGEPPSFSLAWAFHGRTRGDGTTLCRAPLRCLFGDSETYLLYDSSAVRVDGQTCGKGTRGTAAAEEQEG